MKKKLPKITIVLLLTVSMMSACSTSTTSAQATITPTVSAVATTNTNTLNTESTSTNISTTPTTDIIPLASVTTITEKLKEADTDSTWSASNSTQISLNGTTATVTGEGATVSGGTVTISKAGTYVLSGTLSKGQIIVSATKDDDVRLVLNGVDITADTNSAIYAQVANKVIIILAEGKTNKFTDGTSYTYVDVAKEEPNASIFSKCDLSINGTGTLIVNGNFNHGIAVKDDLVIASGNITVNSVNAAISGKDSVTILDGVFNLTSKTGDAIKSTEDTDATKGWILIKGGTFNITAYNDAIQAYTILEINGGTFNISSGGGFPGGSLKKGSHAMSNDGVVAATNPTDGSYKGLKSSGNIIINNGIFVVSSYNDAVHANGNVTINGGTLTLQSGSKGIHADSTLTIAGGQVEIKNSYEGIEAAFINFTGGKTNIFSTDDGINANSASGLLTISAGELYINAGGDGIDMNNKAVMSGGTVYIDGPTSSGDAALDYQSSFTISGGSFVANDMGNMSQSPSASSTQNSIMISFTSSQTANTKISLKSADGKTIISYAPQKDFKATVLSSSGIKTGETYSIYSNDTKLCDVTISTTITSIDETGAAFTARMGGGGPGGAGGGQMGGKGGSRPERPTTTATN